MSANLIPPPLPEKKKSYTWLWILLGVMAAAGVAVAIVLMPRGRMHEEECDSDTCAAVCPVEQVEEKSVDITPEILHSPGLSFFGLQGDVARVKTTVTQSGSWWDIPPRLRLMQDNILEFNPEGVMTGILRAHDGMGDLRAMTVRRSPGGEITYTGYDFSSVTGLYWDLSETNYTWKDGCVTVAHGHGGHGESWRYTYTYDTPQKIKSINNHYESQWQGASISNGTYTWTYLDEDSRGNWTRAKISYSGYSEYSMGAYIEDGKLKVDPEYEDIDPIRRDNESASFTVTRQISYHR